MARKTIGTNPLDAVVPPTVSPPPAEPERGETKLRTTLHLSKTVSDRLRAAAYWTPGETLAAIAERAFVAEVDRMEQERGEPFPTAGKLRPGRPPVF